MLIAIVFLVVAIVAWYFLGWRAGAEVLGVYVGALIGSNSPQTFKRSKAGLERIANSAMAKARELAAKGKP